MTENPVMITKASGEQTPFSSEKLRHSLHRSDADDKVIDGIIHDVQNRIYEGITTREIYQLAFALLKKETKYSAAKYKLKRAIMELGPSGFPFEKYIAEILKYHGYDAEVGKIIKGNCVNHEIDVIAKKENKRFLIECKYHNLPGIICDVKIPLYIQARFKDVENISVPENQFHQAWVVTNTKFSKDAIQFGLCAGLFLMGWDYPKKESLREQIDNSGLFPITCLTTLKKSEKRILLDNKIVLGKEICNNPKLLSLAHIQEQRFNYINNEAHVLCKENIPEK